MVLKCFDYKTTFLDTHSKIPTDSHINVSKAIAWTRCQAQKDAVKNKTCLVWQPSQYHFLVWQHFILNFVVFYSNTYIYMYIYIYIFTYTKYWHVDTENIMIYVQVVRTKCAKLISNMFIYYIQNLTFRITIYNAKHAHNTQLHFQNQYKTNGGSLQSTFPIYLYGPPLTGQQF